jgi:hypothetical protein
MEAVSLRERVRGPARAAEFVWQGKLSDQERRGFSRIAAILPAVLKTSCCLGWLRSKIHP